MSFSTIINSSAKMAVATLTSRILGLVREQALAWVFGAGAVTDAFLVAYRVPNMLRDLFAEGSFSSAFVPVFTENNQKGLEESNKLFRSVLVLLSLLTLICVVLIIIFAPSIIELMTPKLKEDPGTYALTLLLMRVMAPFLWLISVAALFMGALNTMKVFFIPSIAPALFNVFMIGSIFLLRAPLVEMGFHPALSLGIGVIGGGLLQALIQLPVLMKKGVKFWGSFQLFSPDTKKILHRLGIGTIGIAAAQINVLISTFIATSTVIGAVSWLTYAFRLFQFPIGIVGVSIGGSNLVHFSDLWKRGEKEQAINLLQNSSFLSLILLIPATIFLFIYSLDCVQLIFQRGAFNVADSDMTALALKMYAIGLPFYGLHKIYAPTYYALDLPQLPVKVSVGVILANIVFCLWATPRYGFQVLALGTSLSMFLNCLILRLGLVFKLNIQFTKGQILKMAKLLVGTGLCWGCTWWLRSINIISLSGFLGHSLNIFIGVVFCYSFFILFLLACGELEAVKKISKRYRKK